MPKKSKTCRSGEKGFALMLTLWVLMIVTVFMLTFSMAVNSNIKNASYLKDKIQASAYADGILYLAAVNLIFPKNEDDGKDTDNTDNKSDSNSKTNDKSNSKSQTGNGPTEKVDPKQVKWFYDKLGKWYIDPVTWTMSEDEVQLGSSRLLDISKIKLTCQVSAEDGKFPLNFISKLEKTSLDMSPMVFNAIKEYLKDSKKNHAFSCVEQLLEVKNIDSDIYDGSMREPGLKNIMTVFSDGKIYLNKSHAKALEMIPGISEGAASRIAGQATTTDKYVKSFDEIDTLIGSDSTNLSEAKKWIALIPKYFRIESKATVYGITCTAECVVKVEGNDIKFVLMNKG